MKRKPNKAVAVDGGIRRPFQIGRSCPAATEPHRSVWPNMNLRSFASIVVAVGLSSGCTLLPPRNYTHGASSRCEVHEVQMNRTVVPIYYGLPAIPLDEAYRHALAEATKSAFPHAQEFVGGGCIKRLGAQRSASIYVCDRCCLAKQDWLSHHSPKAVPNNPPGANSRQVSRWQLVSCGVAAVAQAGRSARL